MTWSKHSFLSRIDHWLVPSLYLLAICSALILLLVVAFLLHEAWPVLNGGWLHFFTDDGWYPLEGSFGSTNMMLASLLTVLGAVLIAAPLGLASAIFQNFYAPTVVVKFYSMLLALLAGIPSVVYGLWGLTVLVPLVAQWQPPGASLFTAIVILALMILPTIALTNASALRAVPNTLLHAAAALGLNRNAQIINVAIPAARSGILGGILLASARALGETMAVLMVAGNVVQNIGLFDSVRTLTANIALEMAYATGNHRASLFASAVILTFLVLLLALFAARIMRGTRNVS